MGTLYFSELLSSFFFNIEYVYDVPRQGQRTKCMFKLKDARSVSLYPYNRSQILQYVKYTKMKDVNQYDLKYTGIASLIYRC